MVGKGDKGSQNGSMELREGVNDLGIKIGTKTEKYWRDALFQAEEMVIKGENDLLINKMIVELAKKKVEEEKEKLK